MNTNDAIYVEFPEYSVDTGIKKANGKNHRAPLGHAMVIAVNENNGYIRGSEYGRYDSKNKGIAHRVTVPNFKGDPTDEYLKQYAQKLYESYSKKHTNIGNKVRIKYIKGTDYNDAVKAMESVENNGLRTKQGKPVDYSILKGITCGSYAHNIATGDHPSDMELGAPRRFFGIGIGGTIPWFGKSVTYEKDK